MTDVYLYSDEIVAEDVVLRVTTAPAIAGRLNHLLQVVGPSALRYGYARALDRGGSEGIVRAGASAHGLFRSDGAGSTWRLQHTQDATGNNPAQIFAGSRLVTFSAIKLRNASG